MAVPFIEHQKITYRSPLRFDVFAPPNGKTSGRIVMATGTRYEQLLIEGQRGLLPGAWDSAELIEHYERLLPEARRLGHPVFGELPLNNLINRLATSASVLPPK